MHDRCGSFIRVVGIVGFIGLMNLCIGIQAHAVPITFQFDGHVNSVTDPLVLFPLPTPAQQTALVRLRGAPLHIQFTFESSTMDSDPSPDIGAYLGALTDLQIGIGQTTFTANFPGSMASFNQIQVVNDLSFPGTTPIDIFNIAFGGSFSGSPIAGLVPDSFRLDFLDRSGTALNSTMLPTVQLDPSDFSQASMTFTMDPSGFFTGAFGPAPIPEPSTMVLFGSGFAGLLGWRWKYSKKN